jgi:5-methylcytosine-specific restriction protein A
MPHAAMRPCAQPGCPNLVAGSRGPRYCAEHLRQIRAHQDEQRGTAAERGYDAEWQRLRREYLRQHPLCTQCGEIATHVHHIIRVRDGGTNDWSNLRGLCARHHNAETMRHDVKERDG